MCALHLKLQMRPKREYFQRFSLATKGEPDDLNARHLPPTVQVSSSFFTFNFKMLLRFYILVLASTLFSLSTQQQCYYPDGKLATGLIPCNASAPVSHCCRESDVCLTNGLCFSAGLGSIVRRGCTEKGWNSTDCPNFCTKGMCQKETTRNVTDALSHCPHTPGVVEFILVSRTTFISPPVIHNRPCHT